MQIDLRQGDCLELMKDIPDKSVDMILCDLPYGMTACEWDSIIPFEPLWEQYKRIIKDTGAIVLTASQPFTSMLVMSNIKMFKCEWIWKKTVGTNFASTKYVPMKEHESVLVFGKGKVNYYPILQARAESGKQRFRYNFKAGVAGKAYGNIKYNSKEVGNQIESNYRCPSSVQVFNNKEKGQYKHPTQKPIALLEYFIKTYTQKNETVLDNCMGSGSTGVACVNTDRNFIGIEINKDYFNIAKARIEEAKQKRKQDTFFD